MGPRFCCGVAILGKFAQPGYGYAPCIVLFALPYWLPGGHLIHVIAMWVTIVVLAGMTLYLFIPLGTPKDQDLRATFDTKTEVWTLHGDKAASVTPTLNGGWAFHPEPGKRHSPLMTRLFFRQFPRRP